MYQIISHRVPENGGGNSDRPNEKANHSQDPLPPYFDHHDDGDDGDGDGDGHDDGHDDHDGHEKKMVGADNNSEASEEKTLSNSF